MRHSCFLILGLFLFAMPVVGQTSPTDSQTLQALLAEVRQIRHDLQGTMITVQRAQILLYQLQGQEMGVARAGQRLDDARARLAEAQSNRNKLVSDIKQSEDFTSRTDNSPVERKQVEELLSQLRAKLTALQNEEQQRQTREIEAEEELRLENDKLNDLREQLQRLNKTLENSGQHTGADAH
jgi:chromosome segregation ATPase